jgi:hypothetical protein
MSNGYVTNWAKLWTAGEPAWSGNR